MSIRKGVPEKSVKKRTDRIDRTGLHLNRDEKKRRESWWQRGDGDTGAADPSQWAFCGPLGHGASDDGQW